MLTYEIVVEKNVDRDEEHHAQEQEFAGILKGFLQYEAGKKELSTWTEEALRRVERLRKKSDKNDMYLLVNAHISLIGNRMEEAKLLLES